MSDPTKPLRVAAVLLKVSPPPPPGVMRSADVDITTTCTACGREQNLFESSIAVEDGDTIYRCCACRKMLVAVTKTNPLSNWKGHGMNLSGDVIRAKANLFVRAPGIKAALLIPGHPDSFDRKDG